MKHFGVGYTYATEIGPFWHLDIDFALFCPELNEINYTILKRQCRACSIVYTAVSLYFIDHTEKDLYHASKSRFATFFLFVHG